VLQRIEFGIDDMKASRPSRTAVRSEISHPQQENAERHHIEKLAYLKLPMLEEVSFGHLFHLCEAYI
jgi:hypothetical protein